MPKFMRRGCRVFWYSDGESGCTVTSVEAVVECYLCIVRVQKKYTYIIVHRKPVCKPVFYMLEHSRKKIFFREVSYGNFSEADCI